MRLCIHFIVITLALAQVGCSALLIAAPYAMTVAAAAEQEAARKRAAQQAEKMQREAEARQREELERRRLALIQNAIFMASTTTAMHIQRALPEAEAVYVRINLARQDAFSNIDLAIEGSAAQANLSYQDDIAEASTENTTEQPNNTSDDQTNTAHAEASDDDPLAGYRGSYGVTCSKGCPCGNTCISCSKKCRVNSIKTKKTKTYKPQKTASYKPKKTKTYKSSYSSGYKSSYRKSSGRRGGRRRR